MVASLVAAIGVAAARLLSVTFRTSYLHPFANNVTKARRHPGAA